MLILRDDVELLEIIICPVCGSDGSDRKRSKVVECVHEDLFFLKDTGVSHEMSDCVIVHHLISCDVSRVLVCVFF